MKVIDQRDESPGVAHYLLAFSTQRLGSLLGFTHWGNMLEAMLDDKFNHTGTES